MPDSGVSQAASDVREQIKEDPETHSAILILLVKRF
jgi:hypothetical protein